MTKTNVIPTKVFALEKKNKEKKEKQPEHSKLPTPSGWRLLVMPFKLKEKSKGGIILTDKTVEESQWSTNVGLVMKMVIYQLYQIQLVLKVRKILWGLAMKS